jgi:PAS domain S-box-containing protein
VTDGSTWGVLTAGVLGDEARALLDAISGGVILQDARGFTIYANRAALDLIGLTLAEITGVEPIREGWSATDEQGNVLGLGEQPAIAALRTGETQQMLVGINLPDGRRRWLWNEAVAVTGKSGRPELVISSFVDLTGRRAAEERLELAIDAGGIGIWDWDIRTDELTWSEHVERLFGLEPDEFEGTFAAFLRRVHPDDRQLVNDAVDAALHGDGRYETELRVVWPDGSVHWLLAVGQVHREADGRPVRLLGLTRDITVRRVAELERESHERWLSFLIEATTVLSESFDYEATLGRFADLVVPLLADWCAIDVVGEHGGFRRVTAAGELPVAEAPELGSVPADVRAGRSTLQHDGAPGGLRSLIVTPLRSRRDVVGALWLGVTPASRSRYEAGDLVFVEELARRVALAIENARLFEDRRRVAETLQLSLLPPALPDVDGLELGAAYRASGDGNDLGGDFYDVFEVALGSWAAVIGDVCGKGPGAAAVTGLARNTLHAIAWRERSPARVLVTLNDAILRRQADDRYLTAVYCRVEPHDGGARVALARGGHPPPLLRRRDGSVRPLGHPGLLLGSLFDVSLTDDEVDLLPGELVVLYTDGVTEARRGDDIFGPGRLGALIAAGEGCSAQELADRIQAAALEFQPGPPRDDVAVLVLRVPPG